MWVGLDFDFAVLRLGLLIVGLALFVWGLRARGAGAERGRALRLALLGFVAASAYGSYFYFYAWGRLKISDTFHYYVASKYSPELGYFRLYDCTLQALDEQGLADLKRLPHVRNLRTLRNEPPAVALQRGPRCKQSFSPARWSEFSADVGWFHRRTDRKIWYNAMGDHGYNPSPVFTLFARPLASSVPLGRPGVRVLVRLDHALVLGAFLFVGFTVGWEVAFLVTIVWGTGFLWRYTWVGDAFLRHIWLASAVVGLCLLQRRRHASAALFLTTAALLQVFPVVFLLGWALHALRELWRTRVLSPDVRRFAVASALTAAVLVPASASVSGRGLAVHTEFGEKISTFEVRRARNKMGLDAVTGKLEKRLARPDRGNAGARGPESKALGAAIQTLRILVVALGLLAFWRALAGAEDWEAAALGMTLVPLLSKPANYYYSFVVAALFLALRRPRIGVVLFLACIAWSTSGLLFYNEAVEFVGASLVAIALSFAILHEMTRPPEAVSA